MHGGYQCGVFFREVISGDVSGGYLWLPHIMGYNILKSEVKYQVNKDNITRMHYNSIWCSCWEVKLHQQKY